MQMRGKLLLIVGGIVVVILIVIAVALRSNGDDGSAFNEDGKISSYEECAAAGGRIQETFPSTCVMDDGSSFTSTDEKTSKYIENFDKAPKALQEALVEDQFAQAKKGCEFEKSQDPNFPADTYITVIQVVQAKFAVVQLCGDPGETLMVREGDSWIVAASLVETPSCELVDQYAISKEITDTCNLPDLSTREVTYP